MPPFALVPQLYTVVMDRTKADRELDALRRRNRVRVVQVLGGTERAVLFTEDYISAIASRAEPPLLDILVHTILPGFTNTTLTRRELLAALAKEPDTRWLEQLLDLGVITVHPLAREPSFAFALPNGGPALKAIIEGRKVRLGFCHCFIPRGWHRQRSSALIDGFLC